MRLRDWMLRDGRGRSLWVLAACIAWVGTADAQPAPPPNFVVIMTDDQRFDSLWAMPLAQQELVARGVHFREAIVTSPVCTPTRASFLSGGYRAVSTGVLDNVPPNGGPQRFNASTTLATRLQAAGYVTGLIGKYINDYDQLLPIIPPGWTSFIATAGNAYVNAAFMIGSSGATEGLLDHIEYPTQYGVDYERDRALEFLSDHAAEPFFLLLGLPTVHEPAVPAPQDAGLFPDYLYRDRAYAEPDISDKPRLVNIPPLFPPIAAEADLLHRDMLRVLQSGDRAIAAVMDHLEQLGLLDRTYVIFMSDNGYLWGEHYLVAKGEAYEESLRVPMVVVAPGVEPRVDDRIVAADLDVPATIQELAGLPVVGDGVSLVPLLADPDLPGRETTHINFHRPNIVWSGVRARDATGDWKYFEWSSGAAPELYDLAADPFEEQNRGTDPAYQAIRSDLAARTALYRGLAITTPNVGALRVGQSYSRTFARWGGVAPFSWAVADGALPEGLGLNANTGQVSGVPVRSGVSTVTLQVTDSSTGLQSGGPQRYGKVYTFNVPASCGDAFDNDGDGLVDLADPSCHALTDLSEHNPALRCDDGIDNDGDGFVDLADPGCPTPTASPENPACDDDIDNDGDGFVDFDDPTCTHAWPYTEQVPRRCGIGAELVAGLYWWSRRRRSGRAAGPAQGR